jgi:amino acid adenylation domain-containing protein
MTHRASRAQQRLWFLEQLGEPVHNISFESRYADRLDAVVLRAAVADLLARHESLRTSFQVRDNQLWQVASTPPDEPPVTLVDLTGAHDVERAYRELCDRVATAVFDLGTAPLLRMVHAHLGPHSDALIIVLHHAVADAISVEILMRDLTTAYERRLAGQAPDWPELTLQYADFTAWQEEQAVHQDLDYWREQLSDLSTLDLTHGEPRPDHISRRGRRLDVTVDPATAKALDEFARAERATPFLGMLAAYSATLGRVFGAEDIAVSSTVVGRPLAEVQHVIGMFVDRVVLRLDLSDGPTFRELVRAARRVVEQAHDHGSVTFDQIVAAVAPDLTPLAQAAINLQPPRGTRPPAGAMPPRTGGSLIDTGTVTHDLSIDLVAEPTPYTGTVRYRPDVVSDAAAERVRELFGQLLRDGLAEPDRPLWTFPAMSDTESVEPPAATEGLVHELISDWAARTPDAPAVVWAGGSLDFAGLDAAANRLAHTLRERGVGPEVPVLVAVPNSAELLVALLGVLKAGGVYVPVDPAAPAAYLLGITIHCGASFVLTTAGAEVALPASVVLRVDAVPPVVDPGAPDVSVLPDNAACLLFTSGSTGQPQGVLVTHRNAVAYVRGLATLGLPVGSSHLLAQPPTFDSSMTAVLGALAGGGALHVVDEDTARDPHALADFLAAHPTDFMKLTPSHLAALLAGSDTRALRPNEAVVLGGEPIGSALATRLLADGWGVIAHYGRTETTIGVSARRLTRGDPAPIGRPLPGVRAYVLDRWQQPVLLGCRGELYIGGPQVTRGYRGSAAATAAAFVPDPFTAEPGARMYRTGDLVRRLPDGSLVYCGRTDRQAKIRGCRIEPGADEAALGIAGPTVVRVPITDRTAVGEYAIEWTDDACLLSFDPSQMDDLSIGMMVESLPCGPGEIADAPGVLVPQKTMDALAGEAHDAYDTTTTDLVVAATMAAACRTAVAVAETGVVRVDPRPDAASLVRAVRAAMRSAHDDDPAVPGVRVIPLPETAAVTEIGTAGDRVIVTLAGSRVLVSGAADAGLGERVRDRLVALVAHCVDAEPVYSAADLDDAGVAALLAALDAEVSP